MRKEKNIYSKKPVALLATSLVNLGIRSLKASLGKIGINSKLYFLNTEDVKYTVSEISQIIQMLKGQRPEIIGFSTIEMASWKTKQLIKAIKEVKILEDCILVVGGVHPTVSPREYINLVDVVAIGEGEEVFPELVEKILSGKKICDIRNLWIRRNGKIIQNEIRPCIEDINKIPLEDYSSGENLLKNGKLVKLNKAVYKVNYPPPGKRTIFLFTARGCSRCCSFCINSGENRAYTKRVRKRSIYQIIKYLKKIKRNNPGLEFVYIIEDDFFSRKKEKIYKFSDMYEREINLPFFLYCTPETVTKEKLNFLVQAGLKILNMGIQSGSERINNSIYNRNISNEEIVKATNIIARYADKIEPVYDLIIGNPYETKRDVLATINLIRRIPKPFRLSVHFLVFYKGTALYKKALEDGVFEESYFKSQFNLHNANKHLRENGKLYFNSIIFWMHGLHTKNRYGLIFEGLLGFLISDKFSNFLQGFPRLIFLFNSFSSNVLNRYERT